MLEPGKWEINDDSKSEMVKNLLTKTRQFSPDTIASGSRWYPTGQQDSQYLGQRFGASNPSQAGAAALARLSPKQEWDINRMQGLQLTRTDEKAKGYLEKALGIVKDTKAQVKDMSDEEKTPIVAKAKEATTALRKKAGLAGTPLNEQSTDTVVRALKISQGEVSDPMGHEVFPKKPASSASKIEDFAHALSTGGQSHLFPVDFHAYDAAMNRTDLPADVGNAHMKTAGVYNHVQDAYREAHAHALRKKLIPSETTLGDYQAMHWLHHQGLKQSQNTRSAGRVTSGVTRKINYLKRNPDLDPVKHGLSPLNLGGFQMGADGN
jgi:hypothetical protein